MNFKKSVSLWALTLLITAGGAFAQVKKKPATAHKTAATAKQQVKPTAPAVLPLDPDVLIGKLPNGLTYYIRPDSSYKHRAELYLINKAGSVLETDAQQGMANFIEQMAFKGTRDFPKDDLTAFLQSRGAKFGPGQNAFTSYDETVYQLSVPTDTLKTFGTAFNVLANWAAYMAFDPAEINAERTIAAEQARMGGKTPQDKLEEQTLPVLLNNSRYALRPPIGKEATINTFNEAAVKSFYADWYRPDMQAIVVVGDFNPTDVYELIKFNFAPLRNPVPEKPQPQYTVPVSPGTVVKFATAKDFPYTMAQIVVRHPQTVVKTPADFLQNIRIALFNQMLGDRVTELTHAQAPPLLFGQARYGAYAGNQDAFTTLAVAGPSGLQTAVNAMVAETERARKFGFSLTELERAKQTAITQITNTYQERNNTPLSSYVAEYERNFLTGHAVPGIDYEYNYYINNIGKISLAEMNALAARIITDQNRVVLIEAPESEKDKLPNQQTVLQWIADADKGLVPYTDDYSNEPLMAHTPTQGTVLSIKVDSTLLVTNVTLNNGVKIILKPTDFTSNQILINGYSMGGTSLASDQDFTSASIASQVITNSGAGNFTQTQLDKMLRGKGLSISPYIGDISQGVSGYSSAENFETAMQLLYLYFTAPRKDADIWKATINQANAVLAHKNNDPGSVYQDTVLAVLNGYNPRGMPTTSAMLNAASLDKAYSFYKDRFADAGNFTFTFTGAFTIDNIMPYLITYLGSLPSTKSNETYKDLGMHPLAGQITKTVYKGVSDKATVQLIYNGSYDYNETNNVQMDALEEILNIRLVDSLKKESGVYSPGIRISYVKIPEGRYKVTISYLCDVSNVDKATAYILDEINKIKANGPVPKDVQLFILREARAIQSQLRNNTYWEANLSAAAQNQQDPDRMLNHIQDLSQVTIESTKEAANKYLNNADFIKLILLPEKK